MRRSCFRWSSELQSWIVWRPTLNAVWLCRAAVAFAKCDLALAHVGRVVVQGSSICTAARAFPYSFLAAFAKNEKDNLSVAERNALSKLVDDIVKGYEAKVTKAAFEKIKAGLEEAKAFIDGSGDKTKYRIHVPNRVNVKKIRTRLGLSQESFAQTYGFALSAVRDWEQGRRQPERSARILLKIVEKEPEAITRALAKAG
jgi:putative transcriptional regulator